MREHGQSSTNSKEATTAVLTAPEETTAADPKEAAENGQPETSAQAVPQRLPRGVVFTLTAAAVVLGLVIVSGIRARLSAESRLRQATDQAAVETVSVVHPRPGNAAPELVLPGNTQAFIDAPIYSRTNGYLKHWYVDIGAHVTQGQLLAEIETPEVDQQLRQAKADLGTAEANLNLSQITATRDQNLLKTSSISTQERDNAVNSYAANQATVESKQANVSRLQQLVSYEKVYAPFAGIITARETDVGALIDAGANAPKELFHIGSVTKLRVYVSVPEVYSRAARSGAPADLTLDEYPGETFHGVLVRNSNSIDSNSRTLLVEVDVDNPQGRLMPGAYVQVHLKLPEAARSLVVPSNTLLFRREGLQVGVVRAGKAELVRITPGHDYGDSMEILAGLQPTDDVIVSPSDSLTNGTQVRILHTQNEGAGE